MTEVAEGRLSLEAAIDRIRKKTRNYAKRQRTFFRHQLPGAVRWETGSLEAALAHVDWNWDEFRKQGRIPGNSEGAGC
jgi:tRNA A37 N6-isopentenylltransferase MiaA